MKIRSRLTNAVDVRQSPSSVAYCHLTVQHSHLALLVVRNIHQRHSTDYQIYISHAQNWILNQLSLYLSLTLKNVTADIGLKVKFAKTVIINEPQNHCILEHNEWGDHSAWTLTDHPHSINQKNTGALYVIKAILSTIVHCANIITIRLPRLSQ